MKFKIKNSEDRSLEFCNLLDSYIHSRNEKNYEVVSSDKNSADINSLYSTLTDIIILLSRKRVNNSLHMHMIMHLSEEIRNFIVGDCSFGKYEELKPIIPARDAELLLKSCYEIMVLAERSTREYKKIEDMYIFKDEKRLIKKYLDNHLMQNSIE